MCYDVVNKSMYRTPEHAPFSELSEKEHAKDLKTLYRIDDTLMWEPELAAEAMQTLREEEKGMEAEAVRKILLRRWIDAFYPPDGIPTSSHLAKQFVVEPTRLYTLEDDLIHTRTHVEKTVELLETHRRLSASVSSQDFEMKIYGTDIYANVARAGTWAKVPEKTVRMIGSCQFSCCTAIVGKSEDGNLCFAHIPGPGDSEVARVGKSLLETKFGPGRYIMISPERQFVDGADPRKKQLGEQANESFRQTAQTLGLEHHTYTEMFPDPESILNNTKQNFGIIVTSDGVQIQRLKAVHHQPPIGRYWNEPYLIEQTIDKETPDLDISF